MTGRKNFLFISLSNFFGMFFVGVIFCIGLFFISGLKVNATALNKVNLSNVSPIVKHAGNHILDSKGNPVTSEHQYHIKVMIPSSPELTYYFGNHYKGAYDWVFLGTGDEYKYTIESSAPVEGTGYYFKDATDNGYLKTYKPDLWYLKGGVYEGGKSGADLWSFQRATELGGLYGYRMMSNRDLLVRADVSDTSSLVVNSKGSDFVIVFERV